MAFRNIFRRRARFLLSVGLLTAAGVVFVAGMSTMSSVQAVLEQAKELRRWDVDVQLADTDQVPATTVTNLVAQIPHVTNVEAWTIIPTSIAQPGQVNVTRFRQLSFGSSWSFLAQYWPPWHLHPTHPG